ncbi:MAG: signal transduction histidine kinase with reciever domain protein, partial [Deltaproteobacteria bacterium]|nr:signal transduction histidine kinase with reciever domain protein [Deltaproteobacteria bacterium]
PPYIFRDAKGHLQGILVDEWRLWEEKTGIKVELQGMDWDKALKTIAEGNAHVIDTIFFTEERAKTLVFSAPYASIDVPIFFHSSISGIKGVESLQGFTIGVKAGDACIDFFKKHGIKTLREYPSYESIVRDAVKQKIKVFCIDAPPGYYYLYKMNVQEQYQQTAPLYTGQFHRAVRKERMDLLKIVEDGFAKISSKEHDEIEKGWRGSKIIVLPYLTHILYLVVGLLILGAMLLLWNYILRRKVAQKTVQLQEAIDSLEKSEDKYRNLFENANEAIFVIQDGKLVFLNPMTRTIAGYSTEELKAKPFVEFIHPDDRDMVFGNYIGRIKGENIPDRYSFRIITKDSNIRWVEANIVIINWAGNTASLIFMVDISERKRAEENLSKSERKFSSTFHFNPSPMAVSEITTGKFINVNEAFANWTGFSREEAIGTSVQDLRLWVNLEDREKIISELTVTGEVNSAEILMRQKNGNIRDVLFSARFIEIEQERYLLTLAYDITERKQTEEEKRKLEDRLRRAEKMEALGQLAGGVAHDLNNVLGVLTGYSELLLAEIPEGQRSRGYVEKILKSTEKGAAIVQDLLTLARRGVTASEVINLNDVVAVFIKTPVFENMKDYHPQVTFRTECQAALLNIKGSPVHLEKALMNLVANAAESIDGPGEVTIRTENRYLDKPIRGYDEIKEGDYVILTVSDTGMGIPAESREKIFEPFYTKKTMGRSGTGLGLSIVWGTVKDHHGHIDVHTEVGKGTAFTLYFPVTHEELTATQQKVPIDRYMGNGESVLVVDDIVEQRDVASSLLKKLGYEVHAVSSGEEAVEYLRQNKADLLILDMIMVPGIDGLETYQRILEINPKQKAVIVSGFSETDRIKEAQNLGAGAYVKKPYVMETLGMAIRDALQREHC